MGPRKRSRSITRSIVMMVLIWAQALGNGHMMRRREHDEEKDHRPQIWPTHKPLYFVSISMSKPLFLSLSKSLCFEGFHCITPLSLSLSLFFFFFPVNSTPPGEGSLTPVGVEPATPLYALLQRLKDNHSIYSLACITPSNQWPIVLYACMLQISYIFFMRLSLTILKRSIKMDHHSYNPITL